MDRLSINLNLIRIRLAHRQRRMDAGNYTEEPASWITLKSNGEHVPLNEAGVAIGGAGGWAKGKSFSQAKSTKTAGKSKKPTGTAAEGNGEDKIPAKPLSKTQLRKNLDTVRQKCSDLHMRITKFNLSPGNSDAVWQNVFDKERLAVAQQSAKEKKEKLDAVKKAINEQEKRGESKEKLQEEFKELDERMNRLSYEKSLLTEGTEKHKQKRKEFEEVFDKRAEVRRKLDNYRKAKGLEEELSKEEGRVETYKERVEKSKKNKAIKEYESMTAEYEKAVQQRNEAILAMCKSPMDCETADDANDYLRAKGYFRKDGESAIDSDARVDISKTADKHAIAFAARVEKVMEDYPWMKGEMERFDCHDFSKDTGAVEGAFGYEEHGKVCLSLEHFGKPELLPASKRKNGVENYESSVRMKFHPQGTDYASVVDHEFTHAMEEVMKKRASIKGVPLHDGKIANEVMKRVQEKLYGSYSGAAEDKVRKAVSGYAAKNSGIDPLWGEDPSYGRNTEFIAEAMSEARTSKKPRKIAVAVKKAMEELMRELDLM